VRAQGAPQQPSSLGTDSSSVSSPVPSEPVVVILDSTMTPPSTPTSASAHSSDGLWGQVEDLSELVGGIDLDGLAGGI
jgi:hypothetical protein